MVAHNRRNCEFLLVELVLRLAGLFEETLAHFTGISALFRWFLRMFWIKWIIGCLCTCFWQYFSVFRYSKAFWCIPVHFPIFPSVLTNFFALFVCCVEGIAALLRNSNSSNKFWLKYIIAIFIHPIHCFFYGTNIGEAKKWYPQKSLLLIKTENPKPNKRKKQTFTITMLMNFV